MQRVPLLLALAACAPMAAAAATDDVPALLHKHACDTCHSKVDAGAGPSWVDVAAKYRGNPRAVTIVIGVIKRGKHGGGPWPMPPLPEVPQADAERIAAYILTSAK